MSNERLGIVEELQAKRAFFAQRQPAIIEAPKQRPTFERGRYIPVSLGKLIDIVADVSGHSREAICGEGRRTTLVNTRAAIANLSAEFAAKWSCLAVDAAMLRGAGSTAWHRDRHADRLKLYPSYADLYRRCRAELLERESP